MKRLTLAFSALVNSSLVIASSMMLMACGATQIQTKVRPAFSAPPYEIKKDEYDSIRESVLFKPDNSVIQYAKVTIVGVQSESSIYYFTNTDHPAYPCFVKRTFSIDEKNTFRLDTGGGYAGDADACKSFYSTMKMVGDMEIRNLWRKMFVPVG